MKPATPLPWVKGWGKGVTGMAAGHHYGFSSDLEDLRKDAKNAEVIVSAPVSLGFIASTFSDSDAAYIAHACNAYPRLVTALAEARAMADMAHDCTERGLHDESLLHTGALQARMLKILRELGELE